MNEEEKNKRNYSDWGLERKKRKMRTGDSRQSIMQNSIKWTNMCRMAVFEVERERKAVKKMLKINGLKLSKLDGRLPIKGGLGLHERIFHDTDVVTQFSQIAEILRERGSD